MSVIPQRGGSAIPADNAAASCSVSGYTTRQFAVLPAEADPVIRLCAAG
jgi:hypothetical protein